MSTEIAHPLKPALTFEQQIERLKTVHNLTIMHEDSALKILEKVNYYRLSAYGIGLKKLRIPKNIVTILLWSIFSVSIALTASSAMISFMLLNSWKYSSELKSHTVLQ